MGLYEGGLFLTMLMFLITGALFLAGLPVQADFFGNLSNEGDYRASASGLDDVNQAIFDVNSSGGNITVSEEQQRSTFNQTGTAFGAGLDLLPRITSWIGFLLFGWIQIFNLVLGGTPFFFLGFLLGIAFDIAKAYFLFHTLLVVISAIRQGLSI